MLNPDAPALVLAPMEGITDAPMRELQGSTGAFSYAVSEFMRVGNTPIPPKVFRRDVPELLNGAKTPSGLPVQVQILGGDPDLMAESAHNAVSAGAPAIDINFGCPAPIVNRHDGGASLLRFPCRIREVVAAVRSAVPATIPVSAKLRLGWDDIEAIHENAAMAVEGGAAWITIHGRTRVQGYKPPVYWKPMGRVRESLGVPVIANGDIWTIEDFRRCREESGCRHFMIGRSALANPLLPYQISHELGLGPSGPTTIVWEPLFRHLERVMKPEGERAHGLVLMRLKQWIKLAHAQRTFPYFDELKTSTRLEEFFERLADCERRVPALTR